MGTAPAGAVDLRRLWLAHDDDALFLRVRPADEVVLQNGPGELLGQRAGRFDWVLFTGDGLERTHAFVLDTETMTRAAPDRGQPATGGEGQAARCSTTR